MFLFIYGKGVYSGTLPYTFFVPAKHPHIFLSEYPVNATNLLI